MIKIWTIHLEVHKGYLPKLKIFRAPRHGDRVRDGGIMGTLVACQECSGVGLLHHADEDGAFPRAVPESDESPDTLVVTLSPTSLDYKIGETVWTHKAEYRVEQITYERGERHMFLLRLDLTQKPTVRIEHLDKPQ
jgi:hypothetical protein